MKDHLLDHGTRSTPQDTRIPGRVDQIENEAGGFVFPVGGWHRLRRFLILGTEGGSFYATERKLTTQNVTVVHECVKEDGPRTVREIVEISQGGKAPQNDTALFALAVCISTGDLATKSAAAEALPSVARIGTHLYHFVAYAETMRGWGRTMRWAVANWYERNPEQLAFQAVKYRQRDGWTHRDLLRLAHPDFDTPEGRAVAHFISGNESPRGETETGSAVPLGDWVRDGDDAVPQDTILFPIIEGYRQAQASRSPEQTAALVREYNLPREALLTEHLTDVDVWRAMVEGGMPLGAMTRNLASMTRYGLFSDGEAIKRIVTDLTDPENVKRSRLHPMSLLVALSTYSSGHGERGGNTWSPVPRIIDALDEAFYLAFDNVESTGKNILLGVDVSGSMNHSGVAGSRLTAREAAVAMALVTLHAEDGCRALGFTTRLYPVGYSRRQRLDDALKQTPRTAEGTDCAAPITGAINDLGSGKAGGMLWDAIVLYTDNQTWAGRAHVSQEIERYRQMSGKPTRLVACGLVANEFSVCDPNDPLSLNVVGFDTSTPALISEFVAGRI